jgi:L-lysine 2,3-aminomutase
MLQRNPTSWQRPAWQRALADAISNPQELLHLLELSPNFHAASLYAERRFPLRVPRAYVSRMRKGDPNDPLLRQVLPSTLEELEIEGYHGDPVGDLNAMPVPGVLHKYHGRVLLITTGACGIHCRYCFRRHFPYGDANLSASTLHTALDYITKDFTITEVILSGGDPLALPDERLANLANQLGAIPHIKRLRIHSRLPIVLPERIDASLLTWLKNSPLQKVMVVHANHPNEIDEETARALHSLQDCGVTVLNQSVLLRGVNDDTDALCALSEVLFAAGVLPYYLHLFDKVQGAAHFDVPESLALRLIKNMRKRLPGYLVPRLVREVANTPAKVPVTQNITDTKLPDDSDCLLYF